MHDQYILSHSIMTRPLTAEIWDISDPSILPMISGLQVVGSPLQYYAFRPWLLWLANRSRVQYSTAIVSLHVRPYSLELDLPYGLIEHALKVPLCECGTFQILMRPDLFGHLQRLFVRHRLHPLLSKRVHCTSVFSQVQLRADQNDGDVWRVVLYFWKPLGLYVVEGRGADDGETNQEYIGLWVGQGSQSVVILLASSVPESQADGLSIDHDAGGVVIEAIGGSGKAVYGKGRSPYTVGIYSPGKALVVYEMRRQV